MEIRHLKTFAAVARHLSFHRAADELHYAQSTVSAQIQDLEEEVGARLFDRMGRGILLTEAGRRLLTYAERMLALEREALAELGEDAGPSGSLVIRIPESLLTYRLPPLIARCQKAMPQVRLEFITCAHEGLRRDLAKGVVDMGFLLTESFSAAELEARALGVEGLVIATGPGHPLTGRGPVEPAELAGDKWLLTKVDCSYRRQLEALLAQEGAGKPTVMEFYSLAAVKRCVAAGLGLTVLPALAMAEEAARGELVALPLAGGGLEAACLMIRHRDKWLSPALAGFMDLAAEELGRQYGGWMG